MGRLLEFLGLALGAVIVCVGVMDTNKVVMEVGVCGRVILVAAKSIANGWVRWQGREGRCNGGHRC